MNLTNKYGYPDEVVAAIRNDTYSKGDSEYSITGLIRPPRISALERLHEKDMEVDVDDEVFKLYGHLGHAVIERAAKSLSNRIVETRYFGTIHNTRISAQVDSLSLDDDGILKDWKFTTVYGFKIGEEPKPEWVLQMNGQLELLRQNGLDAKRMQIWGMLRDWRPGESKREQGYPRKLGYHDIELWPRDKTQTTIRNLIIAHRLAEKELPICSKGDNWSWRRCDGYCSVNKFCSQYQNHLKEKVNG